MFNHRYFSTSWYIQRLMPEVQLFNTTKFALLCTMIQAGWIVVLAQSTDSTPTTFTAVACCFGSIICACCLHNWTCVLSSSIYYTMHVYRCRALCGCGSFAGVASTNHLPPPISTPDPTLHYSSSESVSHRSIWLLIRRSTSSNSSSLLFFKIHFDYTKGIALMTQHSGF